MSWHFSQALEEEYLGANSSAGEPSAPSNGTPTHGMFWSPGKTTDASTRSRSGMMFRPLTDTHGEAVLMSCLAASLVRTSAPQAREPESKESEVECGNTWHELSVKFDPASSSWKTHQCLWEEVLPWSSVTLPKWGLMRDGELWERITAALPTAATESGLLPTPTATDYKGGAISRGGRKSWERPNKRTSGFLSPSAWVEAAKTGGFGVTHGMADWMDRIRCIGNGQVPAVAALAWEILNSNPPSVSSVVNPLP